MLKLKQINKEIVKPVPQIGGGDNRPVLGADLFPNIYSNIFLIARKNSGKTSVIYKIIQECANRDTTIYAFVSTLHKDANWIAIQKYCEKKKIPFIGHLSLKEDGIDLLDELVNSLQVHVEKEKELKPKKQKCVLLCDSDSDDEDDETRKRKSKVRAPEYIFILDDLSGELKSKSLINLLKKNRHILAKIIVSSQYPLDLDPQSRKQIDNFLIFPNQPDDKLHIIYKEADINMIYSRFYEMYKVATEKKYSFLYIDVQNDTYRRNFDYEIDPNIDDK